MMNPIVDEDMNQIVSSPLPWNRLAGCTVLVSGASGFLPAYMVETVLRLNDTGLAPASNVIGLVRNLARARERFAGYLDRSDFTLIEHDVAKPWEPTGPVDWIVHAASPASPKNYITDPVGTIAPNVAGTVHLLELARQL